MITLIIMHLHNKLMTNPSLSSYHRHLFMDISSCLQHNTSVGESGLRIIFTVDKRTDESSTPNASTHTTSNSNQCNLEEYTEIPADPPARIVESVSN